MKTKKITHDEVVQAIRQFQKQGGMIAELPPQEAPERSQVGEEKYQAYESLTALING